MHGIGCVITHLITCKGIFALHLCVQSSDLLKPSMTLKSDIYEHVQHHFQGTVDATVKGGSTEAIQEQRGIPAVVVVVVHRWLTGASLGCTTGGNSAPNIRSNFMSIAMENTKRVFLSSNQKVFAFRLLLRIKII